MTPRSSALRHCLPIPAPRILAGSEVAFRSHRRRRDRSAPCLTPAPFQGGAPAEITERFWLDATDGPIEHLKIGCLSKHWLIPLAEMVQAEQVATPDRDLAALPS